MPYVYLPGMLCDQRVFRHLPPGHVVDLRHSETIQEMLDQVAAAPIDKFHLVGFSMGGHVAQEFALAHPERVTRLTIIASGGEGYPAHEREVVRKSLPLIERGKFYGITDKRLKEFLHPRAYANVELRRLIQDMAGPDAKEVYLRQLRATLDRRHLIEDLPKLKMPTAYIAGADDHVVPVASIEATARAARAAFHKIEECGHFVPLEEPELTLKLVTTTSR